MYCAVCGLDIVDCTCPDIEARLKAIGGGGALAAGMNLAVRRLVKAGVDPDEAKQQVRVAVGADKPSVN